jgi:hypothetical protein
MKWIMMHARGAKPVKSQALRIIEPYLDEPIIKEAAPVKLTGEDESGYAPMGCVLRLADRTDTILASADASVRRTTDTGLTFAGRFGFYSEKDGRPVAMSLIGGTELTKGEFGLRLESPEYRAKIVKLDRATETVTVSPAPPSVSEMVGEYIFVTNPVRRSAYKVLEAKAVPEGAALSLDLDSRIGTGKVAGVGDYEVKTQTPFNLQGFRYYLGARLVNADRTAEYRITEVAAKRAALIDKACHPEAKRGKLAKEFAQGSWFKVYDYGLGDEVVRPHYVSLVRTGEKTFGARGAGRFTVSLPPDYRWERLTPASTPSPTRLAYRP